MPTHQIIILSLFILVIFLYVKYDTIKSKLFKPDLSLRVVVEQFKDNRRWFIQLYNTNDQSWHIYKTPIHGIGFTADTILKPVYYESALDAMTDVNSMLTEAGLKPKYKFKRTYITGSTPFVRAIHRLKPSSIMSKSD